MPKISKSKIWKTYSPARSPASRLDLRVIIMPAAKEHSKKTKLFLHTTRSNTEIKDIIPWFGHSKSDKHLSINLVMTSNFILYNKQWNKQILWFRVKRSMGLSKKKVEKEDLLAEQEMGIICTHPKPQRK